MMTIMHRRSSSTTVIDIPNTEITKTSDDKVGYDIIDIVVDKSPTSSCTMATPVTSGTTFTTTAGRSTTTSVVQMLLVHSPPVSGRSSSKKRKHSSITTSDDEVAHDFLQIVKDLPESKEIFADLINMLAINKDRLLQHKDTFNILAHCVPSIVALVLEENSNQ
jgi:hypothetical protein